MPDSTIAALRGEFRLGEAELQRLIELGDRAWEGVKETGEGWQHLFALTRRTCNLSARQLALYSTIRQREEVQRQAGNRRLPKGASP